MPKTMTPIQHNRQSQKMEADREELADRLSQLLPRDGVAEPQPGLYVSRFGQPHDLVHGFLDPCFCVIAQGAPGGLQAPGEL